MARVIADSGVPFDQTPSLENRASRPEIVEAIQPAHGNKPAAYRHGEHRYALCGARTLGKGNIPAGILSLAMPLSGIFYGLDKSATVQNLIIFAGFIAFALISLGLMVSTSRSVSLLSSAADSIGQGNVKFLPKFHPRQLLLSACKID